MSLVMSPKTGLRYIEASLRTAPRVLTPSGVLVVEILSDSVTNWCEFLRELIYAAEAMDVEQESHSVLDGAKPAADS